MGKTTVEQAIERLFNTAVLKHYKKVTLKYAGGEPTLQPELLMHAHCLAEELSEAHQIDLNAVMLTNGITIPASLLEFSIQHNITWAISLDSLSPARCAMLHGAASSQQVLATLDRFQRNGISPHIIITVNRLNLDELPLLVEFLSERQLRFTINFYRPTKYGTDPSPLRPDNHDLIRTMRNVYAVIENHLPDHSLLSLLLDRVDLSTPHVRACSAGYHYVTIGHHGNVAPCQMLVSQPSAYTTALEPQLPLMPQVQYENFQNPTIFEKEGCDEDCFLRYACAGGCPLDAFHTHGRYNAATSYCEVYRALAPEVLRLEALRLLHYETPVVLGDEH